MNIFQGLVAPNPLPTCLTFLSFSFSFFFLFLDLLEPSDAEVEFDGDGDRGGGGVGVAVGAGAAGSLLSSSSSPEVGGILVGGHDVPSQVSCEERSDELELCSGGRKHSSEPRSGATS